MAGSALPETVREHLELFAELQKRYGGVVRLLNNRFTIAQAATNKSAIVDAAETIASPEPPNGDELSSAERAFCRSFTSQPRDDERDANFEPYSAYDRRSAATVFSKRDETALFLDATVRLTPQKTERITISTRAPTAAPMLYLKNFFIIS